MPHFLSRRLPSRAEVQYLFGLLAFIVFGWSIVGFLYQLPSLRLFLGLGEIVGVLGYRMAFALLECILTTLLLVLLSVLLPSATLQKGFAYKTAILVLTAVVASLLLETYYVPAVLFAPGPAPYAPAYIIGGLSCLLLVVLLLLAHVDPRLRRGILAVLDRTSLFAYLYVPLGILGVVIVAVRLI